MKILFAENLKQLRIENNLTQAQLGKVLYYAQTAVSKWEHGVQPTIGVLWRVADYFDTTVDMLIGRTDY